MTYTPMLPGAREYDYGTSVIENRRLMILDTVIATGALDPKCPHCQRAMQYENPSHGLDRYGRHSEHTVLCEVCNTPKDGAGDEGCEGCG